MVNTSYRISVQEQYYRAPKKRDATETPRFQTGRYLQVTEAEGQPIKDALVLVTLSELSQTTRARVHLKEAVDFALEADSYEGFFSHLNSSQEALKRSASHKNGVQSTYAEAGIYKDETGSQLLSWKDFYDAVRMNGSFQARGAGEALFFKEADFVGPEAKDNMVTILFALGETSSSTDDSVEVLLGRLNQLLSAPDLNQKLLNGKRAPTMGKMEQSLPRILREIDMDNGVLTVSKVPLELRNRVLLHCYQPEVCPKLEARTDEIVVGQPAAIPRFLVVDMALANLAAVVAEKKAAQLVRKSA